MSENLELLAEELLAKCDSEQTTPAEIDLILSEHNDCFDGEECELCESLDFDVLANLALNPAVTHSQQEFIMEKALFWQGRIETVIDSFADNRNIAESLKIYILDLDTFQSLSLWDDIAETMRDMYLRISKNPAFTEDEVAKFREEANRDFSAGI